jgi:hypothetical protein
MKSRESALRKKMYSLIDQWHSSSQTQRAFCESRGISYGTFKHWIRKQKDEKVVKIKGPSPERPLLIPVKVAIPISEPKSDFVPFEIAYPNGVRLQCPSDICKTELKTLITLL